MSHLTLEALARLLDEPPMEEERSHLAACEACRAELDGLRGQSEALAALPRMVPAPDLWPEIRERLLEERLVRVPRARRFGGPLRAAAAVLLFLGGGLLGYTVRGATAGPSSGPSLAASEAAGTGSAEAVEPTGTDVGPAGLQEVEEAQERFFATLDQYMAATAASPADPATRLATLDNIVLTTAAALNEAPADPVINSFHLTALAQRNAMLRQIATSADPVF